MVESALILLTFLCLSLAVIDLGQALFLRSSVGERVRGAARSGAVNYDPVAIKNRVLYGTATPADGAVPSLNLTPAMVSVTRMDANATGDRVLVKVSGYPLIMYTPFLARRVTSPDIYAVQQIELP